MTIRVGFKGLSLFVGVCAISGCLSQQSTPRLGRYEGTLILLSATGSNSDATLQKYAVGAELSFPDSHSIHLEMSGHPAYKSSLDITVDQDGKKASLDIPGTSIHHQQLDTDGTCFVSLT